MSTSFFTSIRDAGTWTHGFAYAKHALYLCATPANFSLFFAENEALKKPKHE